MNGLFAIITGRLTPVRYSTNFTKQKSTVSQLELLPNFHGIQLCPVHTTVVYILEVLFNTTLSLLLSFTLSLSFGFSD
jgi:hypothetical protein